MDKARDIAAKYGVTRTLIHSGTTPIYRIPEVCHGSPNKKHDLAIWTEEGGSLAARCWSRGCSYQRILDALGIEYTYEGRTYRSRDGSHSVQRRRGPNKDLTGNFGTNKDLLLQLAPLDQPDKAVVLVEGEKAYDALRALELDRYTPAHWVGGNGGVEQADYSPLEGREVVLWPDNDDPGLDNMKKAAIHAHHAGARTLWMIDTSQLPEKGDAADCDEQLVKDLLGAATEYEPAPAVSPSTSDIAEGARFTRDAEGLRAALGVLKLEIRRNLRSGGADVRRVDMGTVEATAFLAAAGLNSDPSGWASLHDNAEAYLRNVFARRLKDSNNKSYKLRKESYEEAIKALIAGLGVDPVRVYLESLPPWDGKERLPRMFGDALGAEYTELNAAVAKAFLIGGVKRTYEPGCIHDWVPVLIGPQGAGKSTFCRLLVPEGYDGWYSVISNLAQEPQKKAERVNTAMVVEFKEMRGVGRYGEVKSYIDTDVDTYRPPYARRSQDWKRHWVPIGTANDEGSGVLPDDPTGNMRYAAIPINTPGSTSEEKTAHVRRYMAENREQLWAEAKHRYHDGERNYLAGWFEKLRDSVNDEFQQANQPLEEIILELTRKYAASTEGITLAKLMIEANLAENLSDAQAKTSREGKSMARSLTKLGWIRKRTMREGNQVSLWFPPKNLPASEECSQCPSPRSWLQKYLRRDERGKVCIGCRGVVVEVNAGLCQVCEEDKEPLFEIEDTTGGARVCLDCINKDDDDIDLGLRNMLDGALARYVAEQESLLPLQTAAAQEQTALEAKREQLQLVVRAADASNPTADERQAAQQIHELTRIWASLHYLRAANPDIIFPYESDKAREHIRGFVDAMLADPSQDWDRVNWKKTFYNARVEYEAKLQPAQPAQESLWQSLAAEVYPTGGVAASGSSERPQQAALDKQLRSLDDELEFIHQEISLLEGFKQGQEQLASQIDALTRTRAALVALRDSDPDTVNPVADVEAALRVSSVVGYMRSYPAYPWDSWSAQDWAKILNNAKQLTKDAEDVANLEPLRLETAKQRLLDVLRERVKPMLVPPKAKEQTP